MQWEKPFEAYESIEAWDRRLREQWGKDVLAEQPQKLETVKAFCEFIEKDPDALVAFCFLRRKATGERFGSVKRREAVAEQLSAFRDARGLSGMEGKRLVADVMSFLIHNGVMMHAGMV
ncbi:MAG: hypothetical protein P8Y95_00965 [Gammaproteobacteria bacterium]|jgi:hypothetical protein